MGKKIMDIKMRRDASRGRKSKAGGGEKIKSDSRIYTPEFVLWKSHLPLPPPTDVFRRITADFDVLNCLEQLVQFSRVLNSLLFQSLQPWNDLRPGFWRRDLLKCDYVRQILFVMTWLTCQPHSTTLTVSAWDWPPWFPREVVLSPLISKPNNILRRDPLGTAERYRLSFVPSSKVARKSRK